MSLLTDYATKKTAATVPTVTTAATPETPKSTGSTSKVTKLGTGNKKPTSSTPKTGGTGSTTKKTETGTAATKTGTDSTSKAKNDIINWTGHGGIRFFVKSNEIRGLKELNIKATLNTQDKTLDDEKYTGKKTKGSYEITMTAILNRRLGVDVQKLALNISEAARQGDEGFFYCGGKKMFPASFIMTSAEVNNVMMTSKGVWTECEVALTLKQSTKFDGEIQTVSAGSGKGGSGGNKKGLLTKIAEKSGNTDVKIVKLDTKDTKKRITDARQKLIQSKNATTNAKKHSSEMLKQNNKSYNGNYYTTGR